MLNGAFSGNPKSGEGEWTRNIIFQLFTETIKPFTDTASFNMVGPNFLSPRLVNLKLQRAPLNRVKKAGNVHELELFPSHHLHQHIINNLYMAKYF